MALYFNRKVSTQYAVVGEAIARGCVMRVYRSEGYLYRDEIYWVALHFLLHLPEVIR